MIDSKMTIAEAIKKNPKLVDKFSQYDIDFCCGSHRVIKEALEEKKIDEAKFIEELNNFKKVDFEDNSWEKALEIKNKKDLINFIIDYHHIREQEMLNEVEKLLEKILKVHYKNHGEDLSLLYKVFMNLKAELGIHFIKEEEIAFPMLEETNEDINDELIDEHEVAGDLLHKIEELTNNFTPPVDACYTYKLTFEKLKELVSDVHKHVFIENNVLFKL